MIGTDRYAVGQQGDVAAIGRWRCSVATLALLRPATGDVWIFGAWPAGDAPAAPVLGGSVPGASTIIVVPTGGCDTLYAVRADGTRVALSTTGKP
jgi:hypothetical protein